METYSKRVMSGVGTFLLLPLKASSMRLRWVFHSSIVEGVRRLRQWVKEKKSEKKVESSGMELNPLQGRVASSKVKDKIDPGTNVTRTKKVKGNR